MRLSLSQLLVITLTATAACAGSTTGSSRPGGPLASVLETVANAKTADLRAGLAARRAHELDLLHEYRIAGEFPMDAVGPVSVFVDEAGRHCPMAALISQSGRDDLVAEVVNKNNQLKLAAIHDGPLMDWILDSGLTKDEVVLVQGAMDIDMGQFEPTADSMMTAAAQHLIREKLRKIEDQLRANTATSLDLAVAGLVKSPRSASKAPVVPKQLEAAWVPRRVAPLRFRGLRAATAY